MEPYRKVRKEVKPIDVKKPAMIAGIVYNSLLGEYPILSVDMKHYHSHH